MRSVLMISYDSPPSPEVGAQACAQIARHLPAYGWMPTVLTARHDGSGSSGADVGWQGPVTVVSTATLPHPLSLYKGLKARRRRGSGEGPFSKAGERRTFPALRQRLISLLSVPDDRTGWILPAILGGLRAIRRDRVEHLFSTAPSWSNHLVGLGLARLTGLPWTIHFRDPWTEWTGRASTGFEARIERHIIRRANSVVCVTDRHTELLRRLHPECPIRKFVTITNGYDGSEWESLDLRAQAGRRDVFRIVYTGELYLERNPLPLFRAVGELIDRGAVGRDHVAVELFGRCETAGGQNTTDLAQECGISDRVRVFGPVDHQRVLRELVASNLLLLLAEGWNLQIPQKTYEYLRAGRPILALTGEGALADLLRRTGGADVVDPTNHEQIVGTIHRIYHCWREGKNPPVPDPKITADFDRRVLAGNFAKVFEGVLEPS